MSPTTWFGKLARWVLHNNRLTALVALAFTLVCGLGAATLNVDSDLLSLLPDSDPSIIALKDLDKEEGGVNLVTVAVTGEREATGPFLEELEARLNEDPRVDYALYSIEDDLAWRLGVMNLDTASLEEIRDRLKGALSLGPSIANPFIAGRLLALGPLTEQLQSADARDAFLARQSEEGGPQVERIIIRPSGAARDLPFARDFMAGLDTHIAELKPEERGVEIAWIGGAYRYNVEDYEGIVFDMRWTGIASVVMVLLLLGIALRDPRVLPLIFVPLAAGTIWTFGFAALTIGTLNSFTSVMGALLVGMGIDFAIHLYTRYREERETAQRLEDAIVSAWDKAGPPCMAAAVTSAGGFLALTFAEFKGFAQLGLLLAVGVLLCLAAVVTLLPLMIRWREMRPRAWRRQELRLPNRRPPTYRLAPMSLLALVLVSVVMAFLLPRIGLEYDLSELRRDGMSYNDMDAEEQVLVRQSYAAIIASYPDAESLSAARARIQGGIDSGEVKHVDRLVSLESVIPADQQERLDILAEIRDLSDDEYYSLLPVPVKENLAVLDRTPPEPVVTGDLPHPLQHLLGASGGKHRLMLFASGNVWDLREVTRLREEVLREVPDVPVAGEYLTLGSLADVIKRDAPVVGLAALILVTLGTLIDLKRPLRALGAITILLLGMVWAGGAIALAKVKLSIVNVVGIPILLGIGVDVVIHLLHRLAEEGPGKVLKALTTTGWASGLSAATTILSFASLALATNQGIRSLGLLVLVGLTTVTLAAFLLVPTGWMTAWKIMGDAPADKRWEEDEEA